VAVPSGGLAPEAERGGTSYVDWPAIFAGTAVGVALSVVLLTFGSAIGLSVVSFEPGEGGSLFWIGIVSGLWFIWVAVTSFGAGGYVAGRMRRRFGGASVDEAEVRDGVHGLVVWAVATIIGAMLAAGGISGAIGAAGRATGTVAETAAQAIGGDLDYLGSRLMRGTNGSDPAIDGQTVAVLARSVVDGTLDPADRDYLAGLVAERTGQPPDQAAAQVDAAFAEAQQLYDEAVQTAEQARVAAAIAAFLLAATLLTSAAAAYLAAVTGGDHRDRNLPFGGSW
jgi:hypothetical protein